MNLNSLRECLPISVESTPRRRSSAAMVDADLRMPDLVTDGGGGYGSGSGSVTPRTVREWDHNDGGDEEDDSADALPINLATLTEGASREQRNARITQTSSLVDSFNEVYQRQIHYYEQNYEPMEASKLKEGTYKRWVSDFSEHNRVMLATIADMEFESERRLEVMGSKMREERQRQDEDVQEDRIHRLQDHVRTLVRFIRRAQAEGVWRTEGLPLQDQQLKDLLQPGNIPIQPDMNVKLCIRMNNNECEEQMISIPLSRLPIGQQQVGAHGGSFCEERKLPPKRQQFLEKRRSVPLYANATNSPRQLNTVLDTEYFPPSQHVVNDNNNHRSPRYVAVQPITMEQQTDQDLNWKRRCEKLNRENHDLNKNLLDNRVLALEVAEKHDQILRLKAEVNLLEENLRQANMQTHFKDDVIKELRRDYRNILNPYVTDTKRSVSVCTIPKQNDYETPKSGAEQRREQKANEHNTFLNELGVLMEVLDYTSNSCNDPLEKRIIEGVRELKEKWRRAQEDRDVLRKNNQELEAKLGQLLGDNLELNRINQTTKHDTLRQLENQRTHLQWLKDTMVATQTGNSSQVQLQQQQDQLVGDQADEDEDFLMTDTNRVLLDANQMLIDLKNEIDNKNLLISNNSLLLEGLKEEVAKKTQSVEELRRGHREVVFEKDKMIIDLENSIRNHNNRIEDLEVEKLHLEAEVMELKRTVERNPISDQLQTVTSHKNQLEIECANQKTTISNLKDALESLKKDSSVFNRHETTTTSSSSLEVEVLGDLLRQFFSDNLSLDQKLDLLRDENLSLKSKLFHALCGLSDEELLSSEEEELGIRREGRSQREASWRKTVKSKALHRRVNVESVDRSSGVGSMPESGFLIGGSTTTDQRVRASATSPHRGHLFASPFTHLHREPTQSSDTESSFEIRVKMEKQCNEKLNEQRLKYDQLLSELTSDLDLLTTQIAREPDDSKPLERTIEELERQNDRLQKSIVDHEQQFNGELKDISIESSGLKRKVAELEYLLRGRETSIEELKCSEASLLAELNLQKQICKCHYEKIDNQDALSIRLQELHQLLNQKSAEAVRGASALRWKAIEMERMGKLAGEEKKRLRDEIEAQMKALSGAKNRVMELERNFENKVMEVTKLNEILKEGEEKECQVQNDLKRHMEQLSSLEKQVFKDKSLIRELSDELDKQRMDGRERETMLIDDLTKSRAKFQQVKEELVKTQDLLCAKRTENESVRAENAVFLKECKSLREDNMQLRGTAAAMEGRCESLTEALKCNKFEMNALQQEINRLAGLEDLRENNRIFIKQNQDLMARYDELQTKHSVLKEQSRILVESKEQLQISIESSKIWQKEYKEREEIINGTLMKQNDHIKSLLEERKELIVKTNELQNELIITTSTLDKYRDKLGTSSNDQYPEYAGQEANLLYEEEEDNYNDPAIQQPAMMRYGSDPDLRDLPTPLQYLSKVQQLAKQIYRTGRHWKDDLRRQLLDDFYLM